MFPLDNKISMNKLFFNTNIWYFVLVKGFDDMFYKKDPTGFDTVVDPPQIQILMVLNFSIDFMF